MESSTTSRAGILLYTVLGFLVNFVITLFLLTSSAGIGASFIANVLIVFVLSIVAAVEKRRFSRLRGVVWSLRNGAFLFLIFGSIIVFPDFLDYVGYCLVERSCY